MNAIVNIPSAQDTLPQATLFFQEGTSDKTYQCQVVEQAGGFVVNFQYGRRGAALTAGCKTPKPVALDAAIKVFTKLVGEKTAKGYTPAEGGTAYQDTQHADRATGLRPQLLNAIDPKDLPNYMRDDRWVASQKYDGERRMVIRLGDEVRGVNRNGLVVALPMPIVQDALRLSAKSFVIDGEIIGDRIYAFDLIEHDGADLRGHSFDDRDRALSSLLAPLSTGANSSIFQAPVARGTTAKQALHDTLMATAQEGVVFKDADAPYTPGRPASGGTQLKLKFVESATLEVSAVSTGKRSVAVQGYDKDGGAVALGNVTIPANHTIPQPGAIVEVGYLYAYDNGGSLFQPTYKGVRGDRDVSHCVTSQLKYKAEHQDAVTPEEETIRRLPRP